MISPGRTLAAAAGGDLGPVDQDPDQVRQRACDLTRVSCGPSTTRPPNVTSSHPTLPGFVGQLLLAVLVLALVAGLVVVVVHAVRGRRQRVDRAPSVESAEIEIEPIERQASGRSAGDWRAEAADHRAAGRFRDAVRCRYRALVADLARIGALDEIPGRTTGEERAELTDAGSPAAPDFAAATVLFDELWYGSDAATIDHDDRFVTCERDALAAAMPGRRPPSNPQSTARRSPSDGRSTARRSPSDGRSTARRSPGGAAPWSGDMSGEPVPPDAQATGEQR